MRPVLGINRLLVGFEVQPFSEILDVSFDEWPIYRFLDLVPA